MPAYFLRIEGVNHGNIIDDTDDLSTRRGGGLMILNAPRQLKGDIHPGASITLDALIRNRLTIISTGASIGLFKFEAANDAEAEELARKIREHFRTEQLEFPDPENEGKTKCLPLQIGTFVVDVAPMVANEPEAEHRAEQLVLAKNRWRQMQEPTLSLDRLWDQATEPCHFDMIRPGTIRVNLPENKTGFASATVDARRIYGRCARQQFYEQEIGTLGRKLHFTDSFKELAVQQIQGGRKIPAEDHFKDKLAVFYVDGNGFGKRGREAFRSRGANAYGKWSAAVREHHRALLKNLIELTTLDDTWRYDDAKMVVDRIRLETLLWGGDEILFVVPAWKGWELAKWFFSFEHKLKGEDGTPDEAVSYTGGLVFCHAKAPIKNVTALAKKIAENAKDLGRVDETSIDRGISIDGHRLSYEVLESFDDITGDLDEHRRRWLPSSVSVESLILDPTKPFWEPLQRIAESTELPLRQLYMLCKAWRTGKAKEAIEPYERRLKREKLNEPVTAFLQAFDNKPVAWLHLLQMLPYIPESENGGAA